MAEGNNWDLVSLHAYREIQKRMNIECLAEVPLQVRLTQDRYMQSSKQNLLIKPIVDE